MKEYTKKFSEILIKLRKNSGKTQEELAKAIGITRQSLSRYEYGARTPNIELLAKTADFFDVSTDYLIGRNDDISYMDNTKGKVSTSSQEQLNLSGERGDTMANAMENPTVEQMDKAVLKATADYIISTANYAAKYAEYDNISILPEMIEAYIELRKELV